MTRPAPPLASSCGISANKSSLRLVLGIATTLLVVSNFQSCSAAYYGKSLGKLTELHHGVSGEVFAVDGRTLFIKDFTYDGEGPAAYFYAGNSKAPIINGFRIRDERGTNDLLRRYRKEGVTLTLPEGKTLSNIKWFSIWCDDFSVNFGDVRIPRNFDYPRPQKLAQLKGIHGVESEPVVVVDAQTLLIPSFSYDGEAPDAKFWAGPGPNPTPQGIKIPDENGKTSPLRKYDHKTIVLTLPGDLTVHQLGHFGVWCEAFTVDFAHVDVPQALNVPPSLKMLGISPQSKLNCEVLQDDLAFEVRWAVAGDSVVVQLVAKLDGTQYMSFGLSPDQKKSIMVGGDVVVAWVDKQTLQGYAVDYFLDAKSQCSGHRGSCPDTRIQENSNSIRLLNAAMVNGYSIVTYQRPLKASDELDVPITTNGSQAIIWAIGPLNERKEVSFHSDYLKKDQLIEFGRPPKWNCPMPDSQEQNHPAHENLDADTGSQGTAVTTRRPQRVPPTPAPASKRGAWEIPPIQCDEPEDGVFYAQMGPTGGKHGYPAITGHVGWGISWYINGLLIPEINVVRGKKYTFVVEGGSDPETPARYHPFYITDDPIGGYQHKTPEEKENIKIFAGVKKVRGTTKLTGVGRLCNWVPDQNKPLADEFTSFGAYQRTLTLECDHGEPGIVEWTPDKNTPDTVYYHCYTHRHLGWKINVHDECDAPQGSASQVREIYAEFHGQQQSGNGDLEGGESIRVPSKVTPGPEYFQDRRIKHTLNPTFIANTNHHGDKNIRYNQASPASPHLIRLSNNQPPMFEAYDQRFQSFEDGHTGGKYSHGSLIITHNKSHQPPQSQSYHGGRSKLGQMSEVREREQDRHPANSQQKLITDSRTRAGGPLASNYGMKFAVYAQGAPTFSRPSQDARRPSQGGRRPNRPIAPAKSPMPQRPVQPQYFTDRKKPVHRPPPPPPPPSQSPHNSQSNKRPVSQITSKLTKTDFNQNTIESKMSQGEGQDRTQARNTGFKPESVVVEGGFKPIIRITDVTDFAEDRRFEVTEDEGPADSREYRPFDSFEPMFIPSPPDRNQSKNLKKKMLQVRRIKPRLEDTDPDVMEAAADGVDAYYLPASSSVLSQRPRSQRPSDAGALVTADGTQVLDPDLARSIPKVSEPTRIRVSSDVLSRTPQFGHFRGELPPPIPGTVVAESIRQLSGQRQFGDGPSSGTPSGNTRLTLVQRSKRSPHHVPGHDDEGHNTTSSIETNARVTKTDQANRHSEHDFGDGHLHDHTSDPLNHNHDHDATAPSAGEFLFANIEYLVLTAVLYFVI